MLCDLWVRLSLFTIFLLGLSGCLKTMSTLLPIFAYGYSGFLVGSRKDLFHFSDEATFSGGGS